MHAVLERLFDLPAGRADAGARPRDARAASGSGCWRPSPSSPSCSPTTRAATSGSASAVGLLDSYFALEDPTVLEPAERELFVECDLESGLRLRGYVDRLDVAPDGALRVVDYKTGRAPREGFEAKAMFQMRFYALVLWRLRGEVPRLLQLLYLGSGEVLRYEPDEADLRATERKVRRRLGRRSSAPPSNRRLAAEPEQALRLVRPPGAVPRVRRHSPGAARCCRCPAVPQALRRRRAAVAAHPGRRGVTATRR